MDKQKLKEKLYKEINDPDSEIEEELTPQQLDRLEKSIEQCRNGNTRTHEEVQKIARTWISRKFE